MAGVGGYGKEDVRSTFACARKREAGVSQEAFHEVLMNHHDTLNTNTSFSLLIAPSYFPWCL